MSNSRGRTIAAWALRGLLAFVFLGAGSQKLLNPEVAAETFAHFGYSAAFATFIGICEMSGGIGVLLPRVAGLAALGLVAIMAGAVSNHVTHDPLERAIPAVVLMSLAGTVVWLRHGDLFFWKARSSEST